MLFHDNPCHLVLVCISLTSWCQSLPVVLRNAHLYQSMSDNANLAKLYSGALEADANLCQALEACTNLFQLCQSTSTLPDNANPCQSVSCYASLAKPCQGVSVYVTVPELPGNPNVSMSCSANLAMQCQLELVSDFLCQAMPILPTWASLCQPISGGTSLCHPVPGSATSCQFVLHVLTCACPLQGHS